VSDDGRTGGIALGTGVALGVAGLAAGSVFLRRFDAWAVRMITQPERRVLDVTPADLGLDYEEIQMCSEDSVMLCGWLIPAPGGLDDARGSVILGHGISDTMGSLLGFAEWLQAGGYNVLMLDFRGHGRSGGDQTSVGYLEHQDMGAGLRYLEARGLHKIGVMGWSLGAATAIATGAIYKQVVGVVADSCFSRLAVPLSRATVNILHHPPGLAWVEGLYAERLVARSLGFDPMDARPETLVGRISPRPLLLIHSEEDDLCPPAGARRLFERAGEPKELWMSRAGSHAVGPYQTYPNEYRRRVLAFWERAFADAPAAGAGVT